MPSKWDQRFLELAEFVSRWSKDPNARVGAVITAQRRGAIALGYNGFPSGIEDRAELLQDKVIKLDMVVHAEQNALLIAGPRADAATMFVVGKPVCSRCAGLIIQAGITRVVAPDPATTPEGSSWRATGLLAATMLREAGIDLCFP